MPEQVRICSFNYHSFVANIEIINELLNLCDVLMIQETFLLDESLIQSYIGNKYSFCSTSAEQEFFTGRPKGGLLIIWHSYLDKFITDVNYNIRIMGIKLESLLI